MNISLPEAFVNRVSSQLGDELPAFLACYGQDPLRGIRYQAGEPHAEGESVPWVPGAYYLPLDSVAGNVVRHEAGCFYLQEPGAMIPAAVMDARPGETLLDLCAAPGGKSTQLGAAMRGEGLLVCNEPVPKRAQVLSRNIERMRIPNAVVVSEWPDRLAEKWPGGFDGVQVDAPCSGEGMFRRHPETVAEWSPEMSMGCARRQAEILDAAAKLVRPGGRIVYSTCTLNPAENEETVRAFLERHPDFALEAFALPGASAPEGMLSCWPHRMKVEGHFVAKLRKQGEGEADLPPDRSLPKPDRKALEVLNAFAPGAPVPDAVFGKTLVACSVIPDLKGIRVQRVGLHLGEVKDRLFIPDHAWALCGAPESIPRTEISAEDALRFMAGETVASEGKGWTVVTCGGVALGWGKGSDGWIRNHYPKGLRKCLTSFDF